MIIKNLDLDSQKRQYRYPIGIQCTMKKTVRKRKRAVPGMDLHDPRPGLLGGGGGELDLGIRIL
jgi:hypothetical protein